jgi:hypothetical protein
MTPRGCRPTVRQAGRSGGGKPSAFDLRAVRPRRVSGRAPGGQPERWVCRVNAGRAAILAAVQPASDRNR